MKCLLCKKEFKNANSLTKHLRANSTNSIQDYYDKFLKKKNEGLCKVCNNYTKYVSLTKGYRDFCSTKCMRACPEVNKKIIQTTIAKYGVENASQSIKIKEKKENTTIRNYKVKHHLQSKKIKENIRTTNKEKYGVEWVSQRKDIKEKIKDTCKKRYEVEYSLQNEEIKNKIKNTNLKKYGVENVLQNELIKEKIKKYYLNKYNVESVNQVTEVKEKKKQKSIEKYGVTSPLKSKEIINKIKENRLKKFIPEMLKLLKSRNLVLLDTYINNITTIKLKCLNCNNIFETKYDYIKQGFGKCNFCFPKYSLTEQELKNFIKSLSFDIIENNRKIIPPYELDIYIPEKKVAIEYNGLYWHSEELINDKNYHLNKLNLCTNKQIRLIQIFEDEWLFKQEIVKHRLMQLLNISKAKRIHGRLCKIKEIPNNLKDNFLNIYHIQGKDTSSIRLGAFYDKELVAVMTFSKGSIAKGASLKEGHLELNRFCINYNYHIPGIASKLLTYFKRNYQWKQIYSYADRRWSTGNLYKVLGFTIKHNTLPNYWYIKNQQRIHRYNLRKKSNESKETPEWLLRAKEGYTRVWDCGVIKFSLTK